MSENRESLLWLVVVGLLWGGTNPFLRKGSHGVEKVEASNAVIKIAKELIFLLTNFRYVLPFILNQSGSVIYFLCLQNTDLSLAVPVANSLTFVFTAIFGWLLGEGVPSQKMICGMVCVLSGIYLCVLDKATQVL